MKNNKWLPVALACLVIPALVLALEFKNHKTDEPAGLTLQPGFEMT